MWLKVNRIIIEHGGLWIKLYVKLVIMGLQAVHLFLVSTPSPHIPCIIGI